MKIRKKYDIAILLFSLLLFSLGIGWIHSKPDNTKKPAKKLVKKKIKTTVPEPQKAPEPPPSILPQAQNSRDNQTDKKEMTVKEILDYLDEMEQAKGIVPIVEALKELCPKENILEVMEKFIEENKLHLNREQKLHVIISLGEYYKKNIELQQKIFDIIAKHKDIESGEIPLLFLMIEIGKRNVIPDVLAWYQVRKRPETKLLAKKTLEYAAKNDFDKALKKLHEIIKEDKTEDSIKIDKAYATKLLWLVVKNNKGSKSIEFLKSLGADLDNYDETEKITILIQAIRNKNIDTIKELIRLGADVKKASKDKSIGYPLQVARELGQVNIEAILRAKGAKD